MNYVSILKTRENGWVVLVTEMALSVRALGKVFLRGHRKVER